MSADWLEDSARAFMLELLDARAPSGFEHRAADVYRSYTEQFASVRTDRVGNVHATVNEGKGIRVGVMGHLDEIGFIVTKIEKPGIIKFQQIGGWDYTVPVGQRVHVLTRDGDLPGVISRVAVHQIEMKDRGTVKIDDLWIDIGAVDEDDAREKVRPGDPIVVDVDPVEFPTGRLMSRGLDDRIGAFVAAEVARAADGGPNEVVAIGSTREEIGLYGAGTSAYGADLDVCCVIDVTYTSDVPGDVHVDDVELGKGPSMVFGATTNLARAREIWDIGEEAGIPMQPNGAGSWTGTDADAVMRARGGVPTVVGLVPVRNLHTPGEILDLGDVRDTIALVAEWARRIS